MSRITISLVVGAVLMPWSAGQAASDLAPTQDTPGSALGNSQVGQHLIETVGCGTCHAIPGVSGARGLVGPPLSGIASREYIAGMLHNTPDNMVLWLRFPQHVVPGNAMPDMGLSDEQARDIAAYLYTLK